MRTAFYRNAHTLKNAVRVTFPYKGGYYSFQPEQIIRLESDSNYTYIYVSDHKPILMAKVLAEYESMLKPFGFVRTHRSHLINRNHIVSVNPSGEIIMVDTSVIEVSRRKRKLVYTALSHFPHAA